MKFNITEGDWHIGMKPGPIIYGPNGEQIADLSAHMVPDEETIANGKAIAAVPQMLALLDRAANRLQDSVDGDYNDSLAMEVWEFLSQFEAK